MSRKDIEIYSHTLDATVRKPEEHGCRGVCMGDISKAAKISHQAIYLHFASRAEQLAAAIRRLN